MKKVKRFIAILLSITMVCTTSAFASQKNPDSLVSFHGDLNVDLMNEISSAGKIESSLNRYSTKSEDPFSLDLSENQDGSYTGTGKILLETGFEDYSAVGNLSHYSLRSGHTAYIGTIVGEIDNGGQLLSLAIHTVPELGKTFVLANSSIKDNTGTIIANKVYAYGELFDEMNEFVPLYTAERDNLPEGSISEDFSYSPQSVSVSDYNSKFVTTVYGEDGGYDLIALSVFAPKAMKANGQYYMYGKVNSHNNNAKQYAKRNLTPGVITGMTVDQGSITITAQKKGMGFTLQTPEDKSFNVSIPVPKPATDGYSIKWFTIPFIRVDAELKQVGDYNENELTNCAYWYFGRNGNISWSSSVEPKDTEKAFAGQGYITNFNNLRSDTRCNVEFSGYLLYGYTSQFGTTQYTGNFGISTSYDHSVTLVKTSS